jgi:hypothetical protein
MTKLTEKLTSDYFKARNALNQRKGQIIEIFVENEADVPFWKDIFSKHFGQQSSIQTKIHPVSKESLAGGKKTVLKYADGADKFLLLCVDSDYDYLFDGATEQSEKIKHNPFIFQTYAYSIESYQCFAGSLQQIIVEATLCDEELVDFVEFMGNFSKIIYELFLYHCLEERRSQQTNSPSQLLSDCFHKAITIQTDKIIHTGEAELKRLENVVAAKLATLSEIDKTDVDNFRQQLEPLGLTPENTYLFIQGHFLCDKVVMKLLKVVSSFLAKTKFEAYQNSHSTAEERSVKCKEYQNHIKSRPIETLLLTHKNYVSCVLIQKIQADIHCYYRKSWEISKTD